MANEVIYEELRNHVNIFSGFAFKSEDLGKIGIPVVKIKNVNNKVVSLVDTQFFPEHLITSKHSKFFLENGDVLIAMTGQGSVGRVGRLSIEKEKRVLLNQRVGKFAPKSTIDKRYMYYVLSSDYYENILFNAAVGSGQPNLSPDIIGTVVVPIFPLQEQKAIAHILGSLDDKIELNRQMNATLEAMAQALFKSWFVDFDPVLDNALAAGNPIPDELQSKAAARLALGDARKPLPAEIQALFPSSFILTEEMGWIPEGWEVKALDNIIELIGGGTPKTSIKEYWNGDIPWFSVVDAPSTSDVFVIETEKNITQIGLDKSSAKLLPVGTTIISARGTVGKCAIVGKPMAMNQSCYGIRGKNNFGKIFTYYTVFLSVSNLQKNSHGSVFSTITRDTFKSIKAAFPLFELTQAYDAQSEGLFNRILKNRFQEKSLVNLRDTLLPKLLSGELRIPDAENLAAEVL